MKVEYKQIESVNEFIDAIRIRVDVFIKEQGFLPGWEPDEDDKSARQFIGLADGKIVATARFREINGEIKIERMATKKEYRGKQVGKGLLKYMLAEIIKLKPKRIWARSQVRSSEFYEKCGFKAVGSPYDAWGTMHIDMEFN